MKEERSIENISNVRQKDMAAFNSFHETEIYKHHGKSEKDKHRSIAEMRLIALSKPEDLRGLGHNLVLSIVTWVLLINSPTFAGSRRRQLDPKLKVAKLRSVDTSDEHVTGMSASSCRFPRSKTCPSSLPSVNAQPGTGCRRRGPMASRWSIMERSILFRSSTSMAVAGAKILWIDDRGCR